jgi:hypothetical protein
VLRSIHRRLAVRVMRNSRADCRVHLAFTAGGFVARDGMIGALSLLDADFGSYGSAAPDLCAALLSAEQNRFAMAGLLNYATEPSL